MIKVTCKGCLNSVIVSSEEVEELINEQLQLETDLVDDDLYDNRLEICKSCLSLAYDTTCSYCGCFVQFRAKLAYKHCPYPDGARW